MNEIKKVCKLSIGFDVSKATIDIGYFPSGKSEKITNSPRDIKAWIKRQQLDLENTKTICESTGSYEDDLIFALQKAGVHIERAHPNVVKNFMRAQGHQAKTDKIDALGLARFAMLDQRKTYVPMEIGSNAYELKYLWARRQQLMKFLHAEQCRLKIARNKVIIKTLKSSIKSAQKNISVVEKAMLEIVESDEKLNATYRQLQTVQGIGTYTALVLLSGLPELGQIQGKQVAALVGVAPYVHQSGTINKQSRIRGGRVGVRHAIYIATMVAVRYNPQLKVRYEKLVDRGKPKKLALIACANALLRGMNAMLRDGASWGEYRA